MKWPWKSSTQDVDYTEDSIAIYTAFQSQVYRPGSVLYPSCGFDASPARVFDNVTFVDIEEGNPGCIKSLRKAGLRALKKDIREYKPDELHDLLILLNPAIPTEWASRHLKPGGWVLANNYHGNASEMHSKPEQFTLWGVIDFVEKDRRKNDNRVVVSRDLSDLFVPAESGDELKRLRPGYYEFASTVYPCLLRAMKAVPEVGFEDMYRQFQRMMGDPTILPAKRVAERYIFVKK